MMIAFLIWCVGVGVAIYLFLLLATRHAIVNPRELMKMELMSLMSWFTVLCFAMVYIIIKTNKYGDE